MKAHSDTDAANGGAIRKAGCRVVLFHSALGLRQGVKEFARHLREAGHEVHAPDLYDGAVFDDVEAGLQHVAALGGVPALIERSMAVVSALPTDLVYAGFSNGAASAEKLAAKRTGSRGAILMHGALPVEALGLSAWPGSVPVQLHSMTNDPYRDAARTDALAESVRLSGAHSRRYEYPGAGHLFSDPDLPDYDATSATLMLGRVLKFLAQAGTAS